MTFPAYRHLLAMTPAPRHLDGTDQPTGQPVGVAALSQGHAVGLVLADVPVEGGGHPELLSLFVHRDWRSKGLGTMLVGALEEGTLYAARADDPATAVEEVRAALQALFEGLDVRP